MITALRRHALKPGIATLPFFGVQLGHPGR